MIESKVVDSIPTLNENDCQIWWARISDLQSWHYNLLNDIEREKQIRIIIRQIELVRTNESKCRCYENGRRCINRH